MKVFLKNINVYGSGEYPCLSASFLYSKFLYFFKINNYDIVDSDREADVIFLNTCGVSEQLIDVYIGEFLLCKEYNPHAKIGVFGCLAGVSKDIQQVTDYVIPLKKEHLLDTFFEHIISIKNISQFEVSRLLSNDIVKSKKVFYIQTNRGCVHNCSYCGIKKAIGNVTSKPLGDIISEVEQALKSGYDTIHFITDDIGSYGYDIGENFGELFNQICNISPDFHIEISYCEPSEFMKYFDYIKKNFYRVTSMVYPVQSFNDRILKLMNRKYSVVDFISSLEKIRKVNPSIYLINNIIYGYPTETSDEFRNNLLYSYFFDENAFCLYQKITGRLNFLESDYLDINTLYKRKLVIKKLITKYGSKFTF